MDNKKDDNYYLEKLKYHFERINEVMKNIDYDNYVSNNDI